MRLKKYIPKSALLELTLKCNMKCSHCGSSAGIKRNSELTTEQWYEVCQQLSELGCKLVTILGGEPLLRKDWYKIAKKSKDLGMNVTIITNGYLVNDKVIEQFKKLDPYTVGISIDGATPAVHDKIRGIPGAYDRAVDALGKLKKSNIRSTVITTVSKTNIKDLPKLKEFLLNKQTAWQIQLAIPIGRFQKEEMISKEEFYATALFIASNQKKYKIKELPIVGAHSMGYYSKKLPNIMMANWSGCNAGKTLCSIQSDGGVLGCLSLSDKYIEGNVLNRSLKDIWNDADSFTYNRKFNKNQLKNDCRNCSKGSICKGGCLSASESITGMANAGPYCLREIEKSII